MARRQGVRGLRALTLGMVASLVMVAGLSAVPSPSAADVRAVTGGAFNYYTNVSLFGGPSARRGQGQVVCSPSGTPSGCVPAAEAEESASPSVGCPGGGAGNLSVADPSGARAAYGPAVIFGGKQPAALPTAPPSGPLMSSISCSLGPTGMVTASTDLILMPAGSAYPGGVGPGPFIADRVQSTCRATETGVSVSTSIENGLLETKYDAMTGEPTVTEAVPANPPPNYTRTGTLDNVGDSYRIVFNEQIQNPDGSVTVNAAHDYLLGPTAVGEMVIGSSRCGVTGSPDLCTPAPREGYWLVASDGGIFAYCDARFFGSTGGIPLTRPIVGMAPTPSAAGYWLVASDGGIFAYGDAVFRGSTGGIPLRSPIVGMAATPTGGGYWLVAADGGIFAYGDATFRGSAGGGPLNRPIVGMAATPSGGGYWLVASDGGIFAYGDAGFFGSTGGTTLSRPIVGMAATPSGGGYWLVASDGGIFAYGDATFRGSAGGSPLNRPIVGMAAAPSGSGYWLVGSDGGIFTYGVGFYGSTGGTSLTKPIVGMAVPGV